MPRLSSIDELRGLRSMLLDDAAGERPCIVTCAGTACRASGSNDVVRVAKRYIIEKHLLDRLAIRVTGCHGFCEMGPFILTEPQNAFYTQVKMEDVPRIIDALLAGEYIEDLLYRDTRAGEIFYSQDDIPFFKNQRRSILGLNARLDPTRIHDYLAQDGYSGLEKA
ncbi:MAG TPA: NADH-quinone oxidoreductase subunit F, partial [Phycisphaerae bacterium]|nr:NADH-quinone oxidoreductase subunit F [Phycisphaerae bacterium]